jgi:DNA-directed RNA polymerase subunit RPC12/RpoP
MKDTNREIFCALCGKPQHQAEMILQACRYCGSGKLVTARPGQIAIPELVFSRSDRQFLQVLQISAE